MGLFSSLFARELWVCETITTTTTTTINNGGGHGGVLVGYATVIALAVIFIFHHSKSLLSSALMQLHVVSSPPPSTTSSVVGVNGSSPSPSPSPYQFSISNILSEEDLKFLIENLDEKIHENERWENVVDKGNEQLSYSARCCRPKDAPLKYLSVTLFENCSPDTLRDFYMDSDYRLQWDNTVIEHKQLQVDRSTGTEVGCTIKKFPLLMPREYVLAWRLWEGKDKTYYCFMKECAHPLAPPQKKYVRVGFFRSGWRIRKVPGRNACEIKMLHQEDAGLNVEMAKMAFSRGIWSYVCKMENALRKYSAINNPQLGPTVTAVSLIHKVPPGHEAMDKVVDTPTTNMGTNLIEAKESKQLGSSKKVLSNGLLLLGGVVCLSHGQASLASKVVMAYILTKLRKRNASLTQR